MTATDSAAAVRTTAAGVSFSILLAVSFCHLLNDIMQSLLAAIYPMLKRDYGFAFWQIGLLTMAFQVTASLLQPLIGGFTDRRPVPYATSMPVWDRVSLGLSCFWLSCDKLPRTARRCGFRRDRIGNFPSRVVARRANGVRRPPRPGAIDVPGRRQFRDRTRPSAGRLHRAAARTDEHCLVCCRGVARDDHSCEKSAGGIAAPASSRVLSEPQDDDAVFPAAHRNGTRGPGVARLLEIYLSREPFQLLHVLHHSQVRRLRCSSRNSCCSHFLARRRLAPCSAAWLAIASAQKR